jgi:uncharacterized membrane protein
VPTLKPLIATGATRLAVGGVCGLVVGVGLSFLMPWEVSTLVGWDVAAGVFLGWVWTSIVRLPDSEVEAAATREDENRAASDLAIMVASVSCLAGVAFTLVKASESDGWPKAGFVVLAVVSVIVSWGVVHTVFMLRYARIYYDGDDGGVDFNDDAKPNFTDFAYLAFTVGMTYQVSDTDISNRDMRSAVLRHALLSFVFGTVIVAMTINVVAGLLR